MKKIRKSKANTKIQIKVAVQNFKKAIENKLGKINWPRVGVIALFILLTVATKGLLGIKAQTVAVVLFGALRAAGRA